MPTSHQLRNRPLWTRPAWRWLFSLRLGLVLLVLLTIASIAGTLIPPVLDANGQELESALERSQRLVFYSWWYQYLLLLPMALNMALATFRTIAEKVLPSYRPRFQRNPQFYHATANRGEIPMTAGIETAAAAFRKRGFRVYVEGDLGYAFKGLLSRWGAPISHIGMVLVLLGGFGSAWVARETGVWLLEGEETERTAPKVAGAEGDPLGFTIRCDDFETGFFPRTQIASRFTSRVSVREGSQPWRSGTVEVNQSMNVAGWELHQASYRPIEELERYLVAVKGPAQATTATVELSPGQRRPLAAPAGTEVELTAASPMQWKVFQGGKEAAAGTFAQAMRLKAEQFEPDFVMGDGTVGSRSQQLNNPALRVILLDGARPVDRQWLFGREDMKQMMQGAMHGGQKPFTMELVKVDGSAPAWRFVVAVRDAKGVKVGEYPMAVGSDVPLGPAGSEAPAATPNGWNVRIQERVQGYGTYLTMTRNPMIPLIYFGCGVMLLGLLVVFFIRPRQVWFRRDPAAGRLQVAAIYRNNQFCNGLDASTRGVLAELDGK